MGSLSLRTNNKAIAPCTAALLALCAPKVVGSDLPYESVEVLERLTWKRSPTTVSNAVVGTLESKELKTPFSIEIREAIRKGLEPDAPEIVQQKSIDRLSTLVMENPPFASLDFLIELAKVNPKLTPHIEDLLPTLAENVSSSFKALKFYDEACETFPRGAAEFMDTWPKKYPHLAPKTSPLELRRKVNIASLLSAAGMSIMAYCTQSRRLLYGIQGACFVAALGAGAVISGIAEPLYASPPNSIVDAVSRLAIPVLSYISSGLIVISREGKLKQKKI